MKIVNLEHFRRLKPGTVFQKYEPCCFGKISVKQDTWDNDFLSEDISGWVKGCDSSMDLCDTLDEATETGCSFEWDLHSTSRDGCFEDDQLFAVYEKSDVDSLIGKLNKCLVEAYCEPKVPK